MTDFDTLIQVPDLLINAPCFVATNPYLFEAAEANHQWMEKFGLLKNEKVAAKIKRTNPAMFAALTYRKVNSTLLTYGANLIAWLFLFDDEFGEGDDIVKMAETFDFYEDLIKNGRIAKGERFHEPLAMAMENLSWCMEQDTRIQNMWRGYFSKHMRHYFNGCLLEMPYRQRKEPPTFENYRQIRLGSIGAYPVFDLFDLEIGHTNDCHPRARQLAAQMCVWTNDIYSYNKECGENDPLNLVQVLRKEDRSTIDQAVLAAVEVFNRDWKEFKALNCQTNVYKRLEDWIWGNVAWSQKTFRYRSGEVK